MKITFNNNNNNAESTTRHKKKKTQKAWHQGRMATVPKIGVEVRSDGHSAYDYSFLHVEYISLSLVLENK